MKILSYVIMFLFINSIALADITLKWDANTETDLEGYKIYYKTDFIEYSDPTPPEDEVDLGPSPLVLTTTDPTSPYYVDNTNPEFTITGLDYTDKDYWLVITAYDNEEPENESGFSNEVSTLDKPLPGNNIPPSDSGGGCFINTIK